MRNHLRLWRRHGFKGGQCFGGDANRFADSLFVYLAIPIANDSLPVLTASHLCEHRLDQYACSAKSWLAVANLGIGYNVLTQFLCFHNVTFCLRIPHPSELSFKSNDSASHLAASAQTRSIWAA